MLTNRETATILAALLYWREEMCPHGQDLMQPYFDTIGLPDAQPLSDAEIVALSAQLLAAMLP